MTASFNKMLKVFYDKCMYLYAVLISIFSLSSMDASALKIRFPDEELASESVLPLFSPSKIVLNRKISLKHKFEIGGSVSFGLDEPFYFSTYASMNASFYFTESHGLNVSGTYFFPVLSNVGDALRSGIGLSDGQSFNVWGLPYSQLMTFLSYQYTPYYGKISLSKKAVWNISIYGFVGPGLLVFNDGARVPAGNIGVGQKIYFNKWLALKGDIGFYGYHGPSPEKTDVNDVGNGAIRFDELTSKNKSFIINIIASIGVVFLI